VRDFRDQGVTGGWACPRGSNERRSLRFAMRPTKGASARIAVLDNDTGFLQVLGKRLDATDWDHRVLTSPVSIDALVVMRLNALVIDLAAAGPQAWGYLETLVRRLPGLGILICTGRTTLDQRVRGLRLGADDWVTKPCHPEEVVARVETVVRRRKRADPHASASATRTGELEIRRDQFDAVRRRREPRSHTARVRADRNAGRSRRPGR
jgi:DNA-binding response OmpR family regulator